MEPLLNHFDRQQHKILFNISRNRNMADITRSIDMAVQRLTRSLNCIFYDFRYMPDLSNHRGPKRYLFPTGSFATRSWQPGEDVHLVCMGDNSSRLFWEVVGECVSGSGLSSVERDRSTSPVKVTNDSLELSTRSFLHPRTEAEFSELQSALDNTKFFLHYTLTPPGLSLSQVASQGFPEYLDPKTTPAHKATLRRLRTTQQVMATLEEADGTAIPASKFQENMEDEPKSMDISGLPVPEVGPSDKFSSASQAISRLRWDPQHQNIEYEVGYLDRFEGMMWLPLAQWGKAAVEDEEFIPEHRVWLIKRSISDVLVWDRKRRRDWTHIMW